MIGLDDYPRLQIVLTIQLFYAITNMEVGIYIDTSPEE